MNEATRMGLVNQMGFTMGDYCESMRLKQWPLARKHLTKLVAGLGMLAVEIEEADPPEGAN